MCPHPGLAPSDSPWRMEYFLSSHKQNGWSKKAGVQRPGKLSWGETLPADLMQRRRPSGQKSEALKGAGALDHSPGETLTF